MHRRAVAVFLCCAGCGLFDAEQETRPAFLSAHNLESLGPDHDYVAWLVVDGEPVSLGQVELEDEDEVRVEIGVEDAERATEFFVTIEEEGEDGPSDSVIAAGDFDPFSGSTASSSDEDAFGTDLGLATAAFVLDTPSTAPTEDYAFGIWWHDPSGAVDALRVPELDEGWVYEGWVTVNGVRTSTGRFSGPGADSDGAGPGAGSGAGYDAPGQDFVMPATSLVGSTIEITVEPEPDNSPDPFFIEPFALEGILDMPPSTVTDMFRYGTSEVTCVVELELPPIDEGEG
jgi:hypothetical protein